MGKYSKLAAIIDVVLVAALVATLVVLGFSRNGDNEVTLPTPITGTTASPDATTSPTASASATASATPTADPTTVVQADETIAPRSEEQAKRDYDKYLKDFTNVNAVNNFTKEDVAKVLATAKSYANASQTDPYFLSGQWEKDNYDIKRLDATVGQYFQKDLREKINKLNANPKQNKNVASETLHIHFYLLGSSNISGHPACDPSNESGRAEGFDCTSGLSFSDFKYQSSTYGNKPGIIVNFTTDMTFAVRADGDKTALVKVTHTYELNFTINEYYEATRNPQEFVISYYNTKIDFAKAEIQPSQG